MDNKNKNYFEILNDVNVSEYIEHKSGLNYLSWAHAWKEAKKLYPNANYKIYETESGCIYHTDRKTCWVKTGVTIEGIEHIEYLPVMDYKNKSILLENITSFDVNKSIQRSLTKALARHGLGLYVYAGEDLPESEQIWRSKLKEKIKSYSIKHNDTIKNICDDIVKRFGDSETWDEETIKKIIKTLD